jgi:uncharacterized Zn-binding protein involved in type VI secretion
MLPAARTTDPIVCDKHKVVPVPKGGGMIAPPDTKRTVMIGMLPAAREGDKVMCIPGGEESILKGEPSVNIEGKPAARMSDPTGPKKIEGEPPGLKKESTGKILSGCPTVFIGSVAQATPLVRAAENGTPFCEECERGST